MRFDDIPPIFCIAGPTASGKSQCALTLAQQCGGEIINADALQVYDGLKILSARPRDDELSQIPHHLYGYVPLSTHYSVGAWLNDIRPVIFDILARGNSPIITGGTGLYFKALTEGLAVIPEPDPAAMQHAHDIEKRSGIDGLRAEAERLDPAAFARILGADRHRLLRVISVALGTERTLSAWQSRPAEPFLPRGTWRGAALMPERAQLYEQINTRYADMVGNGGLAEAKSIHKLGLPRNLPALKAIGLRELLAHLDGETDLGTAIAAAQQSTRRFAKRQMTWMRGQLPDWPQLDTSSAMQQLLLAAPI